MSHAKREGLPFTKMQAVGNDFVLVDKRDWPEGTDWSQQAIAMCNRHFGVGADGFIVVGPSRVADARMQFFNPDGTPDMCGNGLRCVAAYTFPNGSQHIEDDTASVETPVGIRHGKSKDGRTWYFRMGYPKFLPPQIPVLVEGNSALEFSLIVGDQIFVASSIFTGSTHTVLFVNNLPTSSDMKRLGPLIEHHILFPERTSVLWAVPDNTSTNEEKFNVLIWERGVGETLGCGTGALAVGVLAQATGRVAGADVLVCSLGGQLHSHYTFTKTKGEMVLVGEAELVYRGVWRGEG
jgi:diaminopimelate epimerase